MFIESQRISKPSAGGVAHVALVGNPNTGKTTLFNELTGYRQRVGNYPGVTVERKTGRLAVADSSAPHVEVVDLPGAYGLSARSHDEMVVVDTLTGHGGGARPNLIVAVVDAVDLRRNLFLTSQVLELGIPVVIALNMVDLAQSRGIQVDADALGAALNVAIVPVVATQGQGIDDLKRAIIGQLGGAPPSNFPRMPETIHREVADLTMTLERRADASGADGPPPSRVELLQVLLEPAGYGEQRLRARFDLGDDLVHRRARLSAAGLNPAHVEAEVRYQWIDHMLSRALDVGATKVTSRSDVADRFMTHPVLGTALLIVIMGAAFQSIYAWAAPLMDLIEGSFSAAGAGLGTLLPAGALQSLLVHGVIGGVGAVMTFMPQIMILFLFLAILEDCGYMARAAFLLDRFMGLCGLNGRAFVPLISSFACAVPGIMTTRTIENRADRFVTILVAPLMSCSARLPVYVLLIAAFIPSRQLLGGLVELQAMVLIAMYLVGIVVAIAAGVFLRRVVFRGEGCPFLMELPSYKWPSPKTVLYRMYERAREFVIRAGTIIVAVSILVWAMAYYPRPASIAADFEARRAAVEHEREAQAAAILASAGAGAAASRPPETNAIAPPACAATAALDRLARETDARLRALDNERAGAYLRQSVLGRIGHRIEPLVRPLGWDWRIGTAVIAAFPAREVIIATLGTIYNLGKDADEESTALRRAMQSAKWPDGRPVFNVPVALSVMVFFALCVQCAGTLAVIKRETNSWRWPLITFTYMTALGYLGAWGTYVVAGWFE